MKYIRENLVEISLLALGMASARAIERALWPLRGHGAEKPATLHSVTSKNVAEQRYPMTGTIHSVVVPL